MVEEREAVHHYRRDRPGTFLPLSFLLPTLIIAPPFDSLSYFVDFRLSSTLLLQSPAVVLICRSASTPMIRPLRPLRRPHRSCHLLHHKFGGLILLLPFYKSAIDPVVFSNVHFSSSFILESPFSEPHLHSLSLRMIDKTHYELMKLNIIHLIKMKRLERALSALPRVPSSNRLRLRERRKRRPCCACQKPAPWIFRAIPITTAMMCLRKFQPHCIMRRIYQGFELVLLVDWRKIVNLPR